MKPFALAFDIESTGIDPWSDRIVTAFAAVIDTDGEILQQREWLVNPGVEIPQGAIDVHGVTNEVAATGETPATAVNDILSIIQLECAQNGLPLVGANLSYDLTMVLAEARRHLPQLAEPAEALLRSVSVLDSLVLDKAVDKYRRGSRKLVATAAHYGIELTDDDAHNASFDALAAGRIVLAIMERYPQVSTLTSPPNINVAELHQAQIDWRRTQSASLQAYLMKGDPEAYVNPGWPIQLEESK